MATDAAGIGTSATISAPGWEIRYFEDIVKRLPPCKFCGGQMSVASKSTKKKPHISCRNAGCKNRSRMLAPEEWEAVNV